MDLGSLEPPKGLPVSLRGRIQSGGIPSSCRLRFLQSSIFMVDPRMLRDAGSKDGHRTQQFFLLILPQGLWISYVFSLSLHLLFSAGSGSFPDPSCAAPLFFFLQGLGNFFLSNFCNKMLGLHLSFYF